MPVIEMARYWKAGCSESCLSGLEGAGRKRTSAKEQRAALPPYAAQHLAKGTKIKTVQEIMGHQDIRTTEAYLPLSKELAKKELEDHSL